MTVDVPIHLTQELLDRRGEECPVALATQAAMPGAMVTLLYGCAWIDAPGLHTSVDLPWDMRNATSALEEGFKVDPRTFTLPIPRDVAELPGFLADESLLAPVEAEPMPL